MIIIALLQQSVQYLLRQRIPLIITTEWGTLHCIDLNEQSPIKQWRLSPKQGLGTTYLTSPPDPIDLVCRFLLLLVFTRLTDVSAI